MVISSNFSISNQLTYPSLSGGIMASSRWSERTTSFNVSISWVSVNADACIANRFILESGAGYIPNSLFVYVHPYHQIQSP